MGWSFPVLKYKYIFQVKIHKSNFYQTALGSCYGLKLTKCQFLFKNKFTVLFITTFGTLSFPRLNVSAGCDGQ